MNISLIVIAFGIFQGFFILLFFLFTKRIENFQRKIIILLITSLLLLCVDYVLSNYYIMYTQKAFIGIGWSSSFWMLIVPLYYLLSNSFLTGKKATFQRNFPHFLPFIISIFFNFPFFILSAETRQEYLLSYSSGADITILHIISKGIYHLQLVIYPLLLYKLIKLKKVSTLNFVSLVNICLLILGVGSFIHILSFNLLGLSISWFTSNLIFVSLTIFIHITAYILMIRPNWIFEHIDEVISKYNSSNLVHADLDQIQNDLDVHMIQNKVYLEKDLTLPKLAKLLSITSHQLSEYLNHRNSQTFHNYINYHRVIEAKTMLSNAKNNMYTIEAIAEQVGFNSSATFYRSFKKHTGFSPTKWLEINSEE